MRNAIERFKREWEEDYANGLRIGTEQGRAWAKETASLAVLRHVCEADEVEADVLVDVVLADWGDFGWFDRLAEENGADREPFSAGYAKGFIESATSVWDIVRLELPR